MELKVMKSERMKELADRASHCVCKYCGSPLEVRLVVFGKMEEAILSTSSLQKETRLQENL